MYYRITEKGVIVMKTILTKRNPLTKRRKGWFYRELNANKYLYCLMLPAIIYLIMIDYRAMYGITLAFKDFNARAGIMGSPWVGLKHFRDMFSDSYFIYVLLNTIKISFGRIIFTFPFAIIIAIAFNEIRQKHLKKTLQTIYTFPHFLSWVIASGVIVNFFSYTGPVNAMMEAIGLEREVFLGNKKLIVPLLFITDVWKQSGWNSIIYLAAITGIDKGLYEAAELDGANRWKKIWHITLPSIRGTILVMLTLRVGTVLNAGFDQIFNMSNLAVQKTIDILDTYVYRITFQQAPDFAYSTAVGLFKSGVGFMMVMLLNKISRKLEGTGVLE